MIPAKLKRAGYTSFQVGKWHQGLESMACVPTGRGFDHSYGRVATPPSLRVAHSLSLSLHLQAKWLGSVECCLPFLFSPRASCLFCFPWTVAIASQHARFARRYLSGAEDHVDQSVPVCPSCKALSETQASGFGCVDLWRDNAPAARLPGAHALGVLVSRICQRRDS